MDKISIEEIEDGLDVADMPGVHMTIGVPEIRALLRLARAAKVRFEKWTPETYAELHTALAAFDFSTPEGREGD